MSNHKQIYCYSGEFQLNNALKRINFDIDEAVYACNLSKLDEKYQNWLEKLPRIRPFYAVKCNNDPMILGRLIELGTSFDCASKAEIQQILESSENSQRRPDIIFANPCKPVSHVKYAKEHGVRSSTVDTEFEIYKIFKHYPTSELIVRFRSEASDCQCPLGEKFGCNANEDAATLSLLAKALQLNITGTSFHVGSGCNDYPAYERAIKTAKDIFAYGNFIGHDMKLLDIGGGFPGDNDDKFSKISDIINSSLARYFPDPRIEIIAEPGRYFVAAAFTLICKIHSKRTVYTEGKLDLNIHYYVNDGVYGSFNCIFYDHQKVYAEHLLDDAGSELPKFKTLIWGPTCDQLDKITEDIYLPNLSCGDLIAFQNMGAYTIPVASPFNGFSVPQIVYFQRAETIER